MSLFIPTTPFTPQEIALIAALVAALVVGVLAIIWLFRRQDEATRHLTASWMRYIDVTAAQNRRQTERSIIAALEADDDDDKDTTPEE